MFNNSKFHGFEGYCAELNYALRCIPHDGILRLAELISDAKEHGRRIFVCGNGGSAATASHFACDLQKSTGGDFPVVALTDNIPLITAIGNDSDYANVFNHQLLVLGQEGDLLIVLSASGNSLNILSVLRRAQTMGIKTFALTGFDGGEAQKLADDSIIVKSDSYGIIEDAHSVIMHAVTEALK